MQIRRQRPRTAANGFEKQDEASEAFKDIIIKYHYCPVKAGKSVFEIVET